MDSTRIINIALVAVAAALIAWGISLIPVPAPEAPMQHVLAGQLTAAGNYHYSETADYYTIGADYPATTTLKGSADAKARLTIEQAIAAQIAQFKQDGDFANLTAQDIQTQGLGPDRKYALGLEYQEFPSAHYDSYLYAIYEDTLGAHPNGYFMTFVFDQTGTAIQLSDLFKPGADYLTRLSQLATAQVTQQLSDRLGADAAGDIFSDGLTPTAGNFQNFTVEGNELHIFFPPYQVAAYAAGAFDVAIPLSGLSDILAPDVQ